MRVRTLLKEATKMPQALRVFWKDSRHFWPEILASIAIIAVFVLMEPLDWPGHAHVIPVAKFLRNTVLVLLPISWALLIARSVQDESLVGDRQLWLTRPQRWHQLLIAKLIFAAVYIGIPLGIAKIILLRMAHLAVWGNWSA